VWVLLECFGGKPKRIEKSTAANSQEGNSGGPSFNQNMAI